MTRRLSLADVTSVITLACAALALWVSFGALSFVDVDSGGSGDAYVGVLPSLTWLAVLLVTAGAFAIAIRPSSRAVAPLWLSAVLLLPWLPLPLPLSVLIWTGPIVYWVWIAIAAALAAEHGGRVWRNQVRRRMDPATQALLAAALAAVALGLGTWAVAPQHPDGDEPHYLVITQSIVADHDLRIENNHRQGDYHAYVTRTLKPDFIKRGKDGQIYSIHAPGLPLVVAPAFAIGGYRGVLVALCLIGATAAALVWLVAWRVTADAAASWFGWAVFALSVPFFYHASAVFPDGLGATIVIIALLPLVDARAREPRRLIAVGAALAVLPWLSTRFVPLAAMSALVIAARLVPDRLRLGSRLGALALCPVMSGVAFFLFYQVIYGTPNPSVVYGGAPTMSVSAGTLVRGLPGLLFDQQFGLVPNAPVYLCAFAGLIVMIFRDSVRMKPDTTSGGRRLALELLIIAVPYVLLAASFPLWWGGTSAPARYFAPIAPLLAVPAAVWFATAKSIVARTVSMAALLASLMITATIASVDRGAFLFNFRDGMSRIALWLSPVADLTKALPSLFQNGPSIVLLQTAVWLAAVAVAVAAAAALGRRGRAAVILAFGLTLQVAATAAVSLVWRSNRASIATPYAAGPALLARYDSEANQTALAYRPFQRLDPADLPGRLVLVRAADQSRRRTRVGEAPACRSLRSDGHDGRVPWRPSAAEDRSFVRADRRLGRGLVRPELEETAGSSGCRCGAVD